VSFMKLKEKVELGFEVRYYRNGQKAGRREGGNRREMYGL
jgi:hypothetical protein